MRYLISPTAWGMLTSPTGWGLLAGLVGLAGYLPYLRDAWRRTSHPDPAAWLIWTVEYSVLLVAQAAQHPPWAALCLAGLQLAGTIAVLGVLAARGEWRWGFGRGVLLGGSVATMAVWPFTHTPGTAMCLVLAVEGAGMVLVILGAYRRPGSETTLTWKAFTLAGLLDLRALAGMTSPLLYAYPAFFVVMGSAVLIAIGLGRRRARVAAGRLQRHPQDDADRVITVCHEAHGAHGHWVLEAPRPRLAPARPGLPAAAGPAPPAAAPQPAFTAQPAVSATAVQPALPATTRRRAIPAARPVPAARPALPAPRPVPAPPPGAACAPPGAPRIRPGTRALAPAPGGSAAAAPDRTPGAGQLTSRRADDDVPPAAVSRADGGVRVASEKAAPPFPAPARTWVQAHLTWGSGSPRIGVPAHSAAPNAEARILPAGL